MAVEQHLYNARSVDGDVRVDDFLNDKLQTFADFETLDSLIDRVKTQQALLKKQLQKAEKDLQSAQDAADGHQASMQLQYREFEKGQAEIDRRLVMVTGSDISEDAVRRFEPSIDKLRKLEIANSYIEMLHEVDQLSHDADQRLQTSPEFALQTYGQLRNQSASLQALQVAADGAAPHLLDHVRGTTLRLHNHIKDSLTKDFERILGKLLWPKPGVAVPEAILSDWNLAVGRLLELQKPELDAERLEERSTATSNEVSVLLPLEIMTRSLEQRFRYHFEGNRPTNRLDKPEYFLSHIIDLLNSYSPFVNDFVQVPLLNHFNNTHLALYPSYIDATSALITSLLPMLRQKILSILPQVSDQPQLLSHLIHEVMSFDTTLRTEWQYAPIANETWKGLTNEILVKYAWFDRWLTVERDFALARYKSIIDSTDSGELDYDTVAANSTKPTKAAIRVNDLLETITDRYRPLSSFSQKLRFLIDIQINIFDRFHQRLHSGLEAYRSKTSSIGRAMQGVPATELASLQGIQGLDRVCRVYGSADYLEKAMRDWSDDIFFLELWSELQDRARRHDSHGQNLAGPLSVQDVTARTSAAVGSAEPDDTDTGALFDETAASYRRLRLRSESVLVERLNLDLRDAIRPYYRMNPWASLASSSSPVTTLSNAPSVIDAPSPDLAGTLGLLGTSLGFLKKTLAPLPLRHIARLVAATLDTILWDRVLMGHSFSAAGAAQLACDVGALEGVFERLVGSGQGRVGLRRIGEGVALLNLPVAGRSGAGADVDVDEEAWDVAESDGMAEESGAKLGLWEVEKRVFQDNETAREVLEELGLELLTESDARHVLERRVELGS